MLLLLIRYPMRKSADWIVNSCGGGEHKRLLDLGCGPGLYAELFAEHGFEVVGMDISKRSVEYAKKVAEKNQQRNQFLCMNYLNMDFYCEFDVVVLIYCDFGVLPPSDRAMLLKKIYLALRPGGLFFLDGHSLMHGERFVEKETVEYSNGGFWSAYPYICIERARNYHDTMNILKQHIIINEDDCKCYNIWNQIFSSRSLCAELEAAGFSSIELCDDIAGSEYSGRGEDICAMAKKYQ